MDGWVSIYRELTEGWLWEDKPFSKGQAWIDLIILANYKDNKVPIGDEIILVKRGSFITSELKLMDRWGWSKTKVRSFLVQLMNDKKIMKITDRKKTTITLVNYDVYQTFEINKEPKKDQKKTDERPIKDTTNKGIKKQESIHLSMESSYKKFLNDKYSELDRHLHDDKEVSE